MARPAAQLSALLLLAVSAAGCGATAPSRFYTLGSQATADDAPKASFAVLVGPVSIPGSVDRAEFVVQVAPNRVALEEFHRWAAPLDDAIARTVASDLSVLLGTPDVAVAPVANFRPDFRVTLDVQRFDSIAGADVAIEVVWVVRASASGGTRSGRTRVREAPAGPGFGDLAAAHSRALATVSGDIAAAIRAEATAPGRSIP
jgi:uncharacterized lipoprotein YmbA